MIVIVLVLILYALYLMVAFPYWLRHYKDYKEETIPIKSVTVVNSAVGKYYKVISDKNKEYHVASMSVVTRDGDTNNISWKLVKKSYLKYWICPGYSVQIPSELQLLKIQYAVPKTKVIYKI